MSTSLLKIAGVAVLGIVGIVTVSFLGNALTVGQRVASKTLETNNVIANYEWFYDADNKLDARVQQIKQFREFYEETTDAAEKTMLRMELAAIQQSCRDLAAKYNANSEKMNRSIFKGWSLPASVDAGFCE